MKSPDMTGFDINTDPVLNFGKHKDKKLSQVPLSYLCWLLTNYEGKSLSKQDLRDEAKSRGITFDKDRNPVISLDALKSYIKKTGDKSWGTKLIARSEMKARRTTPHFDFLGNFCDPLNEIVPSEDNLWEDPEFDYGCGFTDMPNME